jgi:alkyldihydroxyacetonephosphate synthase
MPSQPPNPAPEMLWSGWGDPEQAVTLSEDVLTLLEQALGALPGPSHGVELADVRLPDRTLAPGATEAIASEVGSDHVRTDDTSRVRRTRGRSTIDLLRLRGGEAEDAPDAVVLPGSHEEVLAVLRACAAHRVSVVPFGGGTSVVGGLEPERSGYDGVVALDLRRLDRLVSLDAASRTATMEAGLRLPQAEALLEERGFTLGHFPQSYEYATIGGCAATRSSGQASAGYGRFDEMVLGLRVATPEGSVECGRAPASAAGPDLRQLFLGSEGVLGVITSVAARVHPAPEVRSYEAWRAGSFAEGMGALRRLAQDGPLPDVLRLSDETETAVNLALPSEAGEESEVEGCLIIAGYEGTASGLDDRRRAATAVLSDAGCSPLDPALGEGWHRDRYRGPYLRDALLDAGAFVETLETAAFWSSLPALYDAVGAALVASLTDQGTPPLVLCHISHVYPSGASLYFTVACAQAHDPIAQWRRAKAAASDAIVTNGGTITHHHAVGVDHRHHFLHEAGPLAVEALRAVKARLDPGGILNPGILI